MNPTIEELLTRIHQLENQIEAEIQHRREELHADFEDRKIRFEQEVIAAHKRFKAGLLSYIWHSSVLTLLTAPVIYSGIVPLVLLDLFVSLYQVVCFSVYGISRVRRRDYFVFDRGHLAYLNLIEKINCAYCSYGNGAIAYAREISARTEQYWCPIKHARRTLQAHPWYNGFVDFGDAEAWRRELTSLRRKLEKVPPEA
ncbi:MAG TPA: hypothetical protein VF117_06650 [Gammaproteobacteria bacterium]